MISQNAMVSYDTTSQSLFADSTVGGTSVGEYWNWPYYDNIHYYYYPNTMYAKSKIEQAFGIVSVLLKKKVIKELSVSRFIALVNDIAKEI